MKIDLVYDIGSIAYKQQVSEEYLQKSFPFVANIYFVNYLENSSCMNFFENLFIELNNLNDKFILLNSNVQYSYTYDNFVNSDNQLINQKELLPKKQWDMSKTKWVTEPFKCKLDEQIFNSRNLIYKRYGVNCRFITAKNSPIIYDKTTVVKCLELIKKQNISNKMFASNLPLYLDLINS